MSEMIRVLRGDFFCLPFGGNAVIRVELPALFRQLVETFKLAPSPVSKYRIGLGALDYAPLTAAREDVPAA